MYWYHMFASFLEKGVLWFSCYLRFIDFWLLKGWVELGNLRAAANSVVTVHILRSWMIDGPLVRHNLEGTIAKWLRRQIRIIVLSVPL